MYRNSFDVSGPFAAVAALAARQWGVVSAAQILGCGVSRATVSYWKKTGRLVPVYRGVYAVGHAALRPEGHWLAAVLAGGAGARLSHASAAALWDLRRSAAAKIEIAVPRSRDGVEGIVTHRPRDMRPGDGTTHRGVPTTTPTRAVIDLAPRLSLAALESLVANAQVRDLLDHRRLQEARSPKLRKVLDLGPKRTRSWLERRFLAGIRAADLPEPEMNVWMTHGGGEEWQADALYREQRVIVELDGGHHRTRQAFELDRRKDAVRQADGYRTLRFTYRQVEGDLPAVIAVLAKTLDLAPIRRAARGAR